MAKKKAVKKVSKKKSIPVDGSITVSILRAKDGSTAKIDIRNMSATEVMNIGLELMTRAATIGLT